MSEPTTIWAEVFLGDRAEVETFNLRHPAFHITEPGGAQIRFHLARHPDPVGFLRTFAARLVELAADIEAAEPIPFEVCS